MHNQREEKSITRPRETERLNGELEIDYQHNRVRFHLNALREFTFSLPLTPSYVDVVRSLAQITRDWKRTAFATTAEIKLPLLRMKPTAPFGHRFSVFATTPCRGLSLFARMAILNS